MPPTAFATTSVAWERENLQQHGGPTVRTEPKGSAERRQLRMAAEMRAADSGVQGCEGIRKVLQFELKGDPLVIQISGAATPRLNLAVLPAE
jgi:hypothetical protein